jgi:hypothetical protein
MIGLLLVHTVTVKALECALGLVCILVPLTGCATAYEPAASPRVTFTTAGVYKDGQHVGTLPYGTPDAVKGNPRAESEADLGQSMSTAGWVFQAGALGTLTAGTVLAYKDDTKPELALGLLIGALAASLIGDLLWAASHTHSVNAINIYNDGLSPAPQSGRLVRPATARTRQAPSRLAADSF